MKIERIGVVGAGQMGTGITLTALRAGFRVKLLDSSNDALDRARDALGAGLDKLVTKGKLDDETRCAALERIATGTDYAMFSDCDLIIEAAPEKENLKREIFRKLMPALKPDALIVSNTSSISITRLGAATDRPDRFMGLHFMNPVPKMQLVELIRGIATSESTFAAIRDLAAALGKTPVACEDFPAFMVNRILMPMINEAIYTLYEGVGSVLAIDTAMRLGANHPLGPLELADFIGLDTCLGIMSVLHDGLADSKYRPCPLLVKYVEAGWLGQKSGRGFYDYTGENPVPTR